ncbi:MAG: desulfoferrodoxin, partial [Candidatus Gribaldobacteria bacterium]|nr:desulfoferrodoxin [Candidatus Gribaldobacteria bacterium]
MVEMVHTGIGQLVCCGQPMELLAEKHQDEGAEKHLPVIEKTATGFKVKVGSIPHPMEAVHYIEWIEIMFGDKVGRKYLQPGDAPEAEFEFQNAPDQLVARAYCNVHGLWKSA